MEVRGRDDELIVLDAGSGIRALGAHLVETGHTTPVHLFLTHRHGDHVLGLAHFAPVFEDGPPIHLRCGDGERASLAPFVASLLAPPLFPAVDGVTSRLDVAGWNGEADPRAGGLAVRRFTANHPGDAALFRLDDEGGPLLAYAPDNELAYHDTRRERMAWRLDLARFLRDVPVLVHDATYRHDELSRHTGWGHSSNIEAVRLALECGARTLVLFHHHPDRDDDSVEQMLEECREYAARESSALRVLAAWEGLTLSV